MPSKRANRRRAVKNRATKDQDSKSDQAVGHQATESHVTETYAPNQGLIGRLPVDLQLKIYHSLDYPSAIFLAATSRFYRSVVYPSTLIPRNEKIRFIQLAENFPQHTSVVGVPCFGCFRVKKLSGFYHSYVTGKMGKHYPRKKGREPHRSCLECGKVREVHAHNARMESVSAHRSTMEGSEYFGAPVWKCSICRKLGGRFANYGCPRCGICVRVHAGGPPKASLPFCPQCRKGRVVRSKLSKHYTRVD
ncbi:uncharacterized protein BKA78DRAFT_310422 [Phyllosticta capitalensis]|uniref:uncharacterized protein n=1 Tax=Phyllosticta capitalensis TaxID=121624 RepID=UPI003130E12F